MAYRLVTVVVTVLLLVFSAIVHEVAHGWVALRLGDTTARDAGRLTLDPRAHLDGFGSVVLPVVLALMGMPVIGFARPVPYDPSRLRHPRRDELLVALAGPASNLLQALLGALALRLVLAVAPAPALVFVLSTYIAVNVSLAFFNLVPLPPLDGSKVVLYFLRGRARQRYYELQRWSMFILLVVLVLVPEVLRFDPLGWYLSVTASPVLSWLLRLAVG